MGIFNLFNTKNGLIKLPGSGFKDARNSPNSFADSASIAPDERPYYQPDNYYTYYSYPGSEMAVRVITFDERKKTTFPSARGLYSELPEFVTLN